MPTKILIIDHNDSFTFNLVQLFEQVENVQVDVLSVNDFPMEKVKEYDGIVLSPGPGLPENYPQVAAFLKEYNALKPILGVCLGLQHIVTFFGGKLYNQQKVLHGKQIDLKIADDTFLFSNVPLPMQVGLYHSWAADRNHFPACLQITSNSENGVIMSIQHTDLPITAVQFHPESYMTTQGSIMIKNWVESIRKIKF